MYIDTARNARATWKRKLFTTTASAKKEKKSSLLSAQREV